MNYTHPEQKKHSSPARARAAPDNSEWMGRQQSGVPTSVVMMACDMACKVEAGRAAAARRKGEKQGKQRGRGYSMGHQLPEQQSTASN